MNFYLDRLQEALTSATRGMTWEDLERHPEGKWSAAQVLEHLYLTYTGTVKGFTRCLETGRPLVTPPTLRHRITTLVVVGLRHLPGGREAPKNTRPQGMSAEAVLREVPRQIAAMDEIIARTEQRFGKGKKVLDHPILGPLTTDQWRKFHWVHGRHHAKQIVRLRG